MRAGVGPGRSGLGALVFPQAKAQVEQERLDKAALDAALDRYISESEAALTSRIAELRTFFEERKAATPGFAQAVLGTWENSR